MPKAPTRVRAWLFTLNNPKVDEDPRKWGASYVVWQKEKGDEGTIHYQGYCYFKVAKTLAGVKKVNARAHWEVRKGSHSQAKAYCSKQETREEGPWEEGVEPSQGARSDLSGIKEKLDTGATLAEVASQDFSTWAKYRGAFREYKMLVTKPRNFKSVVYVVCGETGVGKSRWAADKWPNAYWKSHGQWWDSYDGQEVVIIDEFYGWLTYSFMLRLLDRYPLLVEVKGGSVPFVSKVVVIISNKDPAEWYDSKKCLWAPLERRIDKWFEMVEGGEKRWLKGKKESVVVVEKAKEKVSVGVNYYE